MGQDGIVVSTVASQQGDPGFDSVWSLHALQLFFPLGSLQVL